MATPQSSSNPEDRQPEGEQIWYELYRTLRPSILAWVYSSGVSSWRGQESDVADDILQETFIRTLKYDRLVEQGKVLPIQSLTSFSRTVAHNCFKDFRRKELRLVRFTPQDSTDAPFMVIYDDDADPSEIALNNLRRAYVLQLLARLIKNFPLRQRTALLTDLANLADFSEERDVLRIAFQAADIELRDYLRPLPTVAAERSRHAASLCIAYKRLKRTFHMRYSSFVRADFYV